MIELNNTTSAPKTLAYLSTKDTVQAIEKLKIDLSQCKSFYDCYDCSYLVTANPDDYADEFTNDTSSFILKIQNGHSVTVTITNTDTNTEYVTADNTYGTYYALGDLKANVFGYVVDWSKVAQLISYGNYKVKLTVLDGASAEFYTEERCFKLKSFSCGLVNGSVRIDFYKKGNTFAGFDYTNLDIPNGFWYDSYRFNGKLKFENHTTEVDKVVNTNRSFIGVQTQLKENFNLELNGINDSRFNNLFLDSMLYGFRITDYNISNIRNLKSRFYTLVDIEEPIPHEINGTYTFNIKLVYSTQTTIRRNV